jgi:hypothetical protein
MITTIKPMRCSRKPGSIRAFSSRTCVGKRPDSPRLDDRRAFNKRTMAN